VKLLFIRIFQLIEEAIAFEKQLKRWSKAKKLALIFNKLENLHNLAECKNHSNYKNNKKP
jgi:putative endonuclease